MSESKRHWLSWLQSQRSGPKRRDVTDSQRQDAARSDARLAIALEQLKKQGIKIDPEVVAQVRAKLSSQLPPPTAPAAPVPDASVISDVLGLILAFPLLAFFWGMVIGAGLQLDLIVIALLATAIVFGLVHSALFRLYGRLYQHRKKILVLLGGIVAAFLLWFVGLSFYNELRYVYIPSTYGGNPVVLKVDRWTGRTEMRIPTFSVPHY